MESHGNPTADGTGSRRVLLLDTRDLMWGEAPPPRQMPVNLNLGLLAAGTLLRRDGFEVGWVDPFVDADWPDRIGAFLAGDETAMALVSVTTSSLRSGLEVARAVRDADPAVPIVWGSFHRGFYGPFIELYPEVALRHALVDYVVLGNEYTARDLARHLAGGAPPETWRRQVRGIGYAENGKTVFTESIDPASSRPCVEEDYGLVDLEKYIVRPGIELARDGRMKRILPISTGEGCPYRCSFCINSAPGHRKRFRLKPAEMIIRQVEAAVERHGAEVIWFQDDNLFAKRDRAFALFDAIERHGWEFQWAGQGRLNYFSEAYMRDDWFKRITRSCLWFGVGFETASDRLRARYHKHVTREMLERVARLCHHSGVLLAVAFIVGTLEETRAEMLETVQYILDLKERFPYTSITYQVYRPYPGSTEYEKLRAAGCLPPEPETLEAWADRAVSFGDYSGHGWLDADGRKALIPHLLRIVSFFNVERRPAGPLRAPGRLVHHCRRRLARWRLGRDVWLGAGGEALAWRVLQGLWRPSSRTGGADERARGKPLP